MLVLDWGRFRIVANSSGDLTVRGLVGGDRGLSAAGRIAFELQNPGSLVVLKDVKRSVPTARNFVIQGNGVSEAVVRSGEAFVLKDAA
jgi:hypothetical protein